MAEIQRFTIDGVLCEYMAHLRSHRDLTESSLRRHKRCVSTFFDDVEASKWSGLATELSVELVQEYASRYACEHGAGAVRSMLSTLRSLLRYLHVAGYLPNDLSAAVPSQLSRQLDKVPRGISAAAVERLLSSIDRTQTIGKRDYAMLQLLNAYGVRGVQVRELRLDDIHWADNQIVFRPAKGGKLIVQHLTPAVGNSLLEYLCDGRAENTPHREVFLTCLGPPRPLQNPRELSALIRRRLQAAGIELPAGVSRGSHSFRHAFATRMVQGAESFKHVGDMLGHKILNSTMNYTKVDLLNMRQAVLEWPEELP